MKRHNLVDFSHNQAHFYVEWQISIVYYVVKFVVEVGNQFFRFTARLATKFFQKLGCERRMHVCRDWKRLGRQRIVIVKVMQFHRITQIDFKNVHFLRIFRMEFKLNSKISSSFKNRKSFSGSGSLIAYPYKLLASK